MREVVLDDLPPGADDAQPVAGAEIGEERDPGLELVVVGEQCRAGVGWVNTLA